MDSNETQFQRHGSAAKLQQLIDQLKADAADYVGRDADVRELDEWIAKTESKAMHIIELQKRSRPAPQLGLPPKLQQLSDQINAEAIGYSGRAADLAIFEGWIAKGDHDQAEYSAGKILKRQRNFRDVQQNGLPESLQILIDQVKAEAIEYDGRAGDAEGIEKWIAQGDLDQAEYKARLIIKRQANFRGAIQNGLPEKLQLLIDQARNGGIDYRGRNADLKDLEGWIARGDHEHADFKARVIIQRQNNALLSTRSAASNTV